MTSGTPLDALRDALSQARVGTGGELELIESSATASISVVSQLHVYYRSGNEYLRLDVLLRALGSVGTVKVFEYRGRGAGEKPRLVVDIEINGEWYQLIYHLGSAVQT